MAMLKTWRVLGTPLVCLLLFNTINAQTTGPTESTATAFNTDIILNQEFRLLWYHWLAIILFCALVIVVLGPSAACLFYQFKRAPRIKYVEKEVEGQPKYVHRDETDAGNMDALFRNMACDYKEIPRTDIRILDRLGIGEFGPLFDAEVKITENDVQRAMVKVFQQGTSQDLVRFREEVERLKCLDHPQVASLFGVVSKSPYYLVVEMAINGDLKTFLRNSSDKEDMEGNPAVDIPKLVAMATDVASGLSYLQCVEYVHKDIAARNCMVTDDLCVKISDFKVGRFLHRSEYAVQADGSLMPLRWMAPESISDNKFTLQSSVWSFGVLLWEVVCRGEFPHARLSDEEVVNDVCENKSQLPRPHNCPDRVYKVMTECWSYDPRLRPHMSLVHRMLESSILTNKYDKSHIRLYS